MRNATKHLSKQLGQYGLNPREWQIEWLQPNFQKSVAKKQVHHLKVFNHKDKNFYFEAEVAIEPKKVSWQALKLMAL